MSDYDVSSDAKSHTLDTVLARTGYTALNFASWTINLATV
jgi:hypothetical protein